MINANELRIGNWVKDRGGKNLQIHRFYGFKIECDVKGMPTKENGIPIYYHPFTEEFEYLQPIPLTPEILEKCGAIVYEFDNGLGNQYRIKDRLFVIRDGNIVDYGSSVIIKHLHQLQNLYFALTNSELIIDL